MKCPTTKFPQAKMNSSKVKNLGHTSNMTKPQKTEEICQKYMQLRSGLTIKNGCSFKKETTKRHSPKTAAKYKQQHLIFASCRQQLTNLEKSLENVTMAKEYARKAKLSNVQSISIQSHRIEMASVYMSTYNDLVITFDVEDIKRPEINVRELGKNQKKDEVLFNLYKSQSNTRETGDDVDGQRPMASLSPQKCPNLCLYANNEEFSVKLQEYTKPLTDPKAFFLLHWESNGVRLECKSNPGVFLGVQNNHLTLIRDQTGGSNSENTKFKLSDII